MKNSLPFLLLVTLFISCQNEEKKDLVTIQVHFPKGAGNKTSINSYDIFLEKTTLGETVLDSIGNGLIELDISKPQLTYYEIGDLRGQLFLEQGYHLSIYVKEESIELQGQGSLINNYLNAAAACEGIFINESNAYFSSKEKFTQQFDSLKSGIDKLYNEIIKTNAFSSGNISFLERSNQIQLNLVKKTYAQVNNHKITLEEFENFNKESILDTTFLKFNSFNYSRLLQRYFYDHYYNGNGGTEMFSEKHLLTVSEKIQNESYPISFKEIFLTMNISSWMFEHGVTPVLDSLYTGFKNEFPQSQYLSMLEKNYNQWNSISNGKIAPDFSGMTLDGNTISLSDLKGKLIYVDVWATWCAPCIEQFPYSIALKKKVKETRSDIEFLYVSVDQDISKWREFVNAKKAPEGIHILEDGSLSERYFRNYTPRYILIGKDGKIINAYAARPSAEGLAELLTRL